MKKSGFRTIFHVYLIFFLSLLGAIIAAMCLFYFLITVRTPSGSLVKSDWPKTVTEEFNNQILFTDGKVHIRQAGIELLQENRIGLQVLNPAGHEIYHYQKPEQANSNYSNTALLRLQQTGQFENSETSTLIGSVKNSGNDYTYLLHFPFKISMVTMYFSGYNFGGGKSIVLLIVSTLFIIVLVSGIFYGFWTTRVMGRLTTAMKEIAARSYFPIPPHGAFGDVYDSLNALNAEIKASDKLREQTEKMREEWISNITHDLKTPLSPIKGYAELLQERGDKNEGQIVRYASVIQKNAAYMETLIEDLKLTYQLKNGMLPFNKQEENVTRFLKELIIDILNNPAYEHRTIHFEPTEDTILYSFDHTLFTRAFQNLILNAFVHGDENTEVTLQVNLSNSILFITVSDNGKGMTADETESLFERYYRGTSTEHKPEGTGLGLAITKSIVELHAGTISVNSIPGIGTKFQLQFPIH